MLRGMSQHQANHHPIAVGVAVLVLGPFMLAAAALYIVVFVLAVLFKLLFGRR
jgi:hypothetical protein